MFFYKSILILICNCKVEMNFRNLVNFKCSLIDFKTRWLSLQPCLERLLDINNPFLAIFFRNADAINVNLTHDMFFFTYDRFYKNLNL